MREVTLHDVGGPVSSQGLQRGGQEIRVRGTLGDRAGVKGEKSGLQRSWREGPRRSVRPAVLREAGERCPQWEGTSPQNKLRLAHRLEGSVLTPRTAAVQMYVVLSHQARVICSSSHRTLCRWPLRGPAHCLLGGAGRQRLGGAGEGQGRAAGLGWTLQWLLPQKEARATPTPAGGGAGAAIAQGKGYVLPGRHRVGAGAGAGVAVGIPSSPPDKPGAAHHPQEGPGGLTAPRGWVRRVSLEPPHRPSPCLLATASGGGWSLPQHQAWLREKDGEGKRLI